MHAAAVLLPLCLTMRAAAGVPDWSGPAAVAAVTDSVKWAVRAVPDGAGGAICVWEENRGRKVCCRDTRDLYAQRLDAAGGRVWDPRDTAVAALDAGEELLGLAASSGGGALVLFRRGNGSLVMQALSPGGTLLHGPAGRVVDAVEGAGEFLPVSGFAAAEDGRSVAILYGLPVEGGMAVRLATAAREGAGWSVAAPVEVDRAMGLHPGALAWCGTRWLVVTWSEERDGVRGTGRWLDPAARTWSPPFDLGTERGRTYAWWQAAGDAGGGAWLVRTAVNAAEYSRTHTASVMSVTTGPRGTVVRRAALGPARTSAMFIPPVMVGTGEQATAAATAPTVAWRPTSWIVPGGRDLAYALRVEGGRLFAAAVRRTGGSVAVSPALTAATGLSDAFTPVAWSRSDGAGVTVIRGLAGEDGVRLESARVRLIAGKLTAGPGAEVARSRSPRVGAVVPGAAGPDVLVYAESLGSEAGGIRAVRVPAESR